MSLSLSAKAYIAWARRFRGKETVGVSEALAQPHRVLASLTRGGEDLRLLSAMRIRFPKAKFVLLLPEEKLWQIREKEGGRAETVTYSIQAGKLSGREHRDLVQRLRAEGFDLGVTTAEGDVTLSDILLFRSGARLRVGKRRQGSYPFLNCLVDSLEEFFEKGLAG
jgi:hypothetical protein